MTTETAVPTDGAAGAGTARGEPVEVPEIRPIPAPAPDTYERLEQLLAGPRPEVRDRVRSLLADPAFDPVVGLGLDEHRERVLVQLRLVAEDGLPRLAFPAEVGGEDDLAGFLVGFEELVLADVSLQVKVGVQFGLFGGAVLQLGSERHHRAVLPDVLDAELLGCFAMSETDHGSDVQRIQTTASYDPRTEEFVLVTPDRGAWKDYIGNAAAHARWAVVFAQLVTRGRGHGVHAFLVRLRGDDGSPRPGVRIEDDGHKLGLNGVDNGRIAFDDVRVARDALLDRFAQVAPDGRYTSPIDDPDRRFFTMLGTLVQGRVAVAGGGVAASRLGLAIAVRHAERRRQFAPADGEPETKLMDYLSHQRRLLPLVARSYALTVAQARLVEELVAVRAEGGTDEQRRRRLETHAAGQKALATWHATRSLQEAREACGGFGYLSENRVGQLRADLDVYTTFEGDNTVLLQLVAKGLLTAYRDEFGDMDPLATVRFVAGELAHEVVDWTNARQAAQAILDRLPGRSQRDALLDHDWQLGLLAAREEHLVASVAKRVRSLVAEGRDGADALNWVQDHVLSAARAHVDRRVHEAFVEAVREVDDEDARELLTHVCDLHGLSVIEEDRAWFIEHDLLATSRSKAVVGTVNALCRRLREHAEGLVDAFGIPEELLHAPIAQRQPDEHDADARDRIARARDDGRSSTSSTARAT